MEFLIKDFELYYQSYLKGNINENTILNSFFSNGCILIMRKCRKNYQILQSSKCKFEAMFYFRNFDLLFQSESLKDVKEMFYFYVIRLCTRLKNELH